MAMMSKVITSISLKGIGGAPAVVWNGISLHGRDAYTDGLDADVVQLEGRPSEDAAKMLTPMEDLDGYRLLPNVDSAPKLLKMCEGFDHPLISQTISGAYIREKNIPVSESVESKALFDAFGVTKPTSTQKRDTKKVVENWCYPSDASSAIPIKDLLAMSKDLRAIITMLLFTVGEACTPEKLQENTSDGLVMLDAGCSGCKCYQRHIDAIPSYRMPGGIADMKRGYEQCIAPIIGMASGTELDTTALETIRGYCNTLISALMSSLTPVLTFDGLYAGNEFASLDGAYAFWAHESLNGKAAVCEHCGNLFIRKRKSGRFCSGACRVAAHADTKN